MQKALKCLILITVGILFCRHVILTAPLTHYMYLSDSEHTVFREIVWFWTPDTLFGRVHSNDYIGLRYSPHFYGPLSSSQDHFIEWQASPYFQVEPQLNAPIVSFPENFESLRDCADIRISSNRNQLITWIRLTGEDGIDIYQYTSGMPRADSLIRHVGIPHDMIIHVDGEVEIEGELAGQLTIVSAGDMGLLDDVYYQGANRRSGDFDEGIRHMLGLLSEGNIIIKDTWANGKANGAEVAPDDYDRHSIIINGSLVALNESFTYEHHNNDWEAYQGPIPDERGYLILKGSLAQKRRGYVHRSNHYGTGYYGKSYRYDNRLSRAYPPGLEPGSFPNISGQYDHLELGSRVSRYRVENTNVGTLIIQPGTEIGLSGITPLIVRDSLIIYGTAEQPVTFYSQTPNILSTIRLERGMRSVVDIHHTLFQSNIETRISSESITATNCHFESAANWTGNIAVDSCRFADEASFTSYNEMNVKHTVFEDGLTVNGHFSDGRIFNNSFVNSRTAGIRIRGHRGLSIINNIIAFNGQGIVNDHWAELELAYNDVWENRDGDYVDCQAGEGCIAADPGFEDLRRGRYGLVWGSPCINAGSPDLPRDPDGSRSDMGALAFDHNDPRDVNPEEEVSVPTGFILHDPYPNPFNSTTTITFDVPEKRQVLLTVHDLAGGTKRILLNDQVTGSNSVTLTCDQFPAGVYFINMQAGSRSQTKKIVVLK